MKNHCIFLKRVLLLFWATWFSLVFLTNLADGAKAAALLPESWTFASGNFRFVMETTARRGTPFWVDAMLFASVIVWEAIATVLFWRAFWAYAGWKAGLRQAYQAMVVALMLWMTFIVVDELFIAYAVEATHFRLFIATLVTVLAMELLPE